jgi:hypothetical protein
MCPASALKPYPSDVSDEEWSLVAPYLTLMKEAAPQRDYLLCYAGFCPAAALLGGGAAGSSIRSNNSGPLALHIVSQRGSPATGAASVRRRPH